MNMERQLALSLVVLALVFAFVGGDEISENPPSRKGKLLSLFSVVRFPNDACNTTDNRGGVCYTVDECSSKGGMQLGSCASGFGVCCLFSATCGDTVSENCTYFNSANVAAGACSLQVCKCNSNICQLRLDFDTFMITGPSTVTASEAKIFYGLALNTVSLGVSASTATQCLTDTFSVSNPGGITPPSICGDVTGEHMYLDASDCCNDLTFQLGEAGVGTSIANRAWSIKVTQYSCDYENLAPEGCTQYYFGNGGTNTVMTFNFDSGQHLANQNQNICVRRERGNCRICWTTAMDTDFDLSGSSAALPMTTQSVCCGYGSSGSNIFGYDCVTIPGAKTAMGPSTMNAPSRICGRGKGLATTFSGPAVTICSTRTPFNIRFLSDQYEFTGAAGQEATLNTKGFKLTFFQTGTNCS